MVDGRLRSLGHEQTGAEPTLSFLNRLTDHKDLLDQVVPLVTTHLRPQQLFEAGAGNAAIRRLSVKVQRIDRLVRVARTDQQGRDPMHFEGFPEGDWLLKRASELGVKDSEPKPIIWGKTFDRTGSETVVPIWSDFIQVL